MSGMTSPADLALAQAVGDLLDTVSEHVHGQGNLDDLAADAERVRLALNDAESESPMQRAALALLALAEDDRQAVVASLPLLRAAKDGCSTCPSTAPNLHPAVQEGGEVQLCPDVFHSTITPENTVARVADLRRDLPRYYPDRTGWWTERPSGAEMLAWVNHRFGDRGPFMVAAKLAAEAGELLDASIKAREGRTDAVWITEQYKETGDVTIVLLQWLAANGWDLNRVVADRWTQVLDRAATADQAARSAS